MARLYSIELEGRQLRVEHHQLVAYQNKGWVLVKEPPAPAVATFERPLVELIEVWRGKERRCCTRDQLAAMADLGFVKKETSDGGKQQDRHSRDPGEGLLGGSRTGGGSSSVGMAGDPVPVAGEEARHDHEPATGAVELVGGSTEPSDPELDPEPEPKVYSRPSTDAEIKAAFAKLDPKNDGHWTRHGLPRLDVLNELLENGPVNRPQFNAVTGNAVRPTK